MKDRASLGGKTSMSTEVISRPAVPVVKHCAEVKACRLPCGNPAVIYTSSSSSHQGMKGCLGEAHITLQRTGSISARFAACWQGTNPTFVSHPPSPSSSRSTARSPTSTHTHLSGSKTHARDGSPAAGCTAPALWGPRETGRVGRLLLQLSWLAGKAKWKSTTGSCKVALHL